MRLFQEHLLVCNKRWKSLSFCEIWNNPTPPLFLLKPITNKHYRTKSSIKSRSNNYLELSKENVLENIMLSHWPCFTWKFFMIWFHKILKLIFQKQPSCPRNICTEHWRKLTNLTAFLGIFLYLKNDDSVELV